MNEHLNVLNISRPTDNLTHKFLAGKYYVESEEIFHFILNSLTIFRYSDMHCWILNSKVSSNRKQKMWNIEKVEKIFQNTSFAENNRSKTLNMLELIELPYKAIFELIQNFILQLYLSNSSWNYGKWESHSSGDQ